MALWVDWVSIMNAGAQHAIRIESQPKARFQAGGPLKLQCRTVWTIQRPQRRAVAPAIQFPAVQTVPRARHHVGFRPYATVRAERTVTCGLTTVRPTRATHMNRIKPSHDFRALGWIVAWSYPEGVPVCAPPVGARALPRCPWQRFVYGQADEVRVGVAGPPPVALAACVYLDTETTGLEPGYDEIVDLAIATADGTFRLRLRPLSPPLDPETELLASRSQLRRLGWRDAEIASLKPASEDYNQVRHIWYPLYRVARRHPHRTASLRSSRQALAVPPR